ncbi:MAG: membrane protein insertion efficiency factor YidD [Clostridiales bacterium]|nr:membrane protein insertion efficiency factor YidD [Clostridiales bacterium]
MIRKKITPWRIIKYVLTFRWLFEGLVLFYKKCISPLTPDVCMFYPSCSSYMLEAIRKFGVLRGVWMGIKRICRCAPWGKGGFDPVPDNPKGDMKWLF